VESLLTWLVRFLHVVGAAFWVGGYAVMAFVVLPLLADGSREPIRHLALVATRLLSFSGALTILAGLVLVARTRGYGRLLGGEWGAIVISAAVLAVALMAIGDAGLRPALRRLAPDAGGNVAVAQRWAVVGLLVGVAALAFMTRALYATT
jgi:putative copper export protein